MSAKKTGPFANEKNKPKKTCLLKRSYGSLRAGEYGWEFMMNLRLRPCKSGMLEEGLERWISKGISSQAREILDF